MSGSAPAFIPVDLRCEYTDDPIGIQAAHPVLSWRSLHTSKGAYQTAYRIVAASSPERLNAGEYDLWDSGIVESSRFCAIPYSGQELCSEQRVYWKVQVHDDAGHPSPFSSHAFFETGLLLPSDWKGRWMGFLGGMIGNGILMRYPFHTDRLPVKARAHICGIGYYELRLNGEKVGDKLLDPGATDYSKTLLYSTYDVTHQIREGSNTIGMILGTGWSGTPKAILQLNLVYSDGETQEIITDWGIGWYVARGPILYNSIYDGEDYDARVEKDGWDTPEYEKQFNLEQQRSGGWTLGTIIEPPGGELIGEILPPIRVTDTLSPTWLRTLPDGRELYDNGINIAGWVRIFVTGERGSSLSLTFAEVLDANGDLDMSYLRSARCQDNYTLRGDRDIEEYAPRFTYHGFRYFTVRKSGAVSLVKAVSETVRSDLTRNASFTCSDSRINQLAQVMWHTDASNLHSIPTDCCQRDERHGWTTDMTARAEGCTYHFDMGSFFDKWVRDIYDTQDDVGYFADTAPHRWGRRPCDPQVNTPISLPLLLYRVYGNKTVLTEHFGSMKKYVEALVAETDDWLISRTGFGEWACPREECYPEPYGAGAVSRNVSPTLVSTAYLYRSILQMKEIADILGERQDVCSFSELADQVKTKFNKQFFHQDSHQYDKGSQSSNVLSLQLGLVDQQDRQHVVANIIRDLEAHEYHLTTGNMGTKAVLDALSENGMEDVAFQVMSSKTSPSFGYMLENGASSIWERWEADTDNNIMNSRNHPMLSACATWFYKYLGGIRPLDGGVAFQQVVIAPTAPVQLSHARTRLKIMAGDVVSEWWRTETGFRLHVSIPFNTEARVVIPRRYAPSKSQLYEGEIPVDERCGAQHPVGIRQAGSDDKEYCVLVGSGEYNFTLRRMI